MAKRLPEEGSKPGAKASARTVNLFRLSDLQAELAKTPEGLKTGLSSLDKLVIIPQAAVTIVAGRTGHGKTTMMFNLLVNMSRLYKDRAFVFFSYEEPRRQLAVKLLSILCGTVVDPEYPARNLSKLEDYLRKGRTDNPTIEEAQDESAPVMESLMELEVIVLKNRNGPVNGRVVLDFDRALLTLREPEVGS